MKYYLDTIEQVKGENDTVNEYGAREKKADYQSAEVAFYQKCANVSNDIGKNHYYMDIRIVDTTGGVVKKDSLGTRVEE